MSGHRPVDWEALEKSERGTATPTSAAVPGVTPPVSSVHTDRGDSFRNWFEYLTGHPPFPWQEALFNEILEKRFPESCDIPTGLGKTSTIAIWLLALAHHAKKRTMADFPRRLVYVVNRRTVVDQATREAEQMRAALCQEPQLKEVADALKLLAARLVDEPLGLSTLRGQFADNAEWRNDPARPAVIVGTVDMIGSRLLWAGYGCGFKSRPLHAGFLGQDALLIHDEAHLEPAFQELITAITSEQQRCCEFGRLRVMALTATSRGGGEQFHLTDADREHEVVQKRIEAKKGIVFCPIGDEKEMADAVAHCALEHKDSGQAILVFLRKLEHVEKVVDKLNKANLSVQMLTGTLRGLERDALAKEDPVFARFMPKPRVTPQPGTVYLVCTSAGEVGIDISADHMVCDLTPFDSMAQRFGRVNRFGNGDARIDVVHCKSGKTSNSPDGGGADRSSASADDQAQAGPDSPKSETGDAGSKKETKPQLPFDRACERTLALMRQLPRRNDQRYAASPAALGGLPVTDRQAAFTPPPVILSTSDILFDAWALTSVRQKLPGRPPVTDWLHGVAEWEPPETHVAWREEVGCVSGALLDQYRPADLLEDYPLKPHELLRDRTQRVLAHLETLAKQCPDLPAWLVETDGEVRVFSLPALVEKDRQNRPLVRLEDCIVLLPPKAGGLSKGMLDSSAAVDETIRYDVADEWTDAHNNARRRRVWDDDGPPEGMRLIRTIDTRPNDDEEQEEDGEAPARRYWRWYARPRSADDDGSRTARQRQELASHLESAEGLASALATALSLRDPEASAVKLAARWHDRGKDRECWQRSIGNRDYPNTVLAKSGGRMQSLDLNAYRHEFGSLLDLSSIPEFRQLTLEVQDLVLHLIAAHHGRARPHFPADEAFDHKGLDSTTIEIAREVPRRFARLQRKYGRWGLAYLESLVRAADALASQMNETDSQEHPATRGKPKPEAP